MRSTEEWEISRSCHKATFSMAGVTVDMRTRRASPVRFSVRTGLRLCGMADEPFWPLREEFLRFQNFGALQVADFRCQAFDGPRQSTTQALQRYIA